MGKITSETAKKINDQIKNIINKFSEYLIASTIKDTNCKQVAECLENIQNLLKKELPNFNIKSSIGAGNRAERPWLLVKQENDKASEGIYFLIIFYKDNTDTCAKISLTQGINEYLGNKDKLFQRAENIRTVLNKGKGRISDNDSVVDIYSELWDTGKDKTELADLLNEYLGYYQEYLDKKILIDYNRILEARKNLVLTGAPGTGKTYLAKEMAAQLAYNKSYSELDKDKDTEQIKFVQFHPSYDYTDFVEGLRPSSKDGQIGFSRQDGIFKAFCKKALEAYKNHTDNKTSAPKKYVFIIDEINRGELSKIFGELFYSIDPGYRGESGRVDTQYQNLVDKESDAEEDDVFKKGFFVPKNVYIIGTMNDIDRSVEPMDFAVRRRFCWMDVKPEDRIAMWGEKEWFATANELMSNLNAVIKNIESLGEPFCLGPAYFNDPPLMPNSNSKEVIDKYDLWKLRIEPILKEYMRPLIKEEASDNMALLKAVFFDGGSDFYKEFCDEKEHTLDEFKKFFEDKKKKNKDKVVEE